jgi:dihydrofolate reductase
MVTLYNVISSDGFIARKDGSEHFIPDGLWNNFLDLCKKYDALIMGRKTYDAIQKYGKALLDPFEKLPIQKIVVTRDRKFRPKADYVVAHSPKDAVSSKPRILVSSGPTLNTDLLREGLVDEIIFHEVPTAIGDGIKPFEIGETGAFLIPMKNTEHIEGVKVHKYRMAYGGTE